MISPERFKLLLTRSDGIPRSVPLEINAGDLQDLLSTLCDAMRDIEKSRVLLELSSAALDLVITRRETRSTNPPPVPSQN